jgi:DNA mismatch endonuclease, patch repair protein
MTDVLSPGQRSFNMSRIRGKDTNPEIQVRFLLRSAGIKGYRANSSLIGKPDLVFPKARLAIFVDGCFWHKCPLDYKEPRTRKKFWAKKIAGNIRRDRVVNNTLSSEGWIVLRIWEHQIKRDPSKVVAEIGSRLKLKVSESRT